MSHIQFQMRKKNITDDTRMRRTLRMQLRYSVSLIKKCYKAYTGFFTNLSPGSALMYLNTLDLVAAYSAE